MLEPKKAALLDRLAQLTRVPKQVLLREAVDDLLTKWRAPTRRRVKSMSMRAANAFVDPLSRQFGFKNSDDMTKKYELRKKTLRVERQRRPSKAPKT